jgi:hypothetical protein
MFSYISSLFQWCCPINKLWLSQKLPDDVVVFNGSHILWRPKFSARLINPNEQVNCVDFGQTTVNPGHHLENLLVTPKDPFWSTLVNPWSNPTQNPLITPLPSSVSQNFCLVLQISPKHFKISQCKSCVFCRGTQLSCWMAFEIWSLNRWKLQVNAQSHYSSAPKNLPTWHAVYANLVEKNPIELF